MAKLSTYRRIVTNDFKEEDQDLVDKLALPINNSFDSLYFTLNGRISLRENIFCTVKDIEVTVGANGIPIQSTSFNISTNYQVLGTQVILATNLSNSSAYPTAQPFVSFTQNGLGVIINHISGLQAGARYFVRIVAYG